MDPIRRKLLKTGAAAAAMAATPGALFARQGANDDGGRFYERGNVRIRYEETGSGFPLLLISGGGLNGSTIDGIRRRNPFNTIEAFSGEFRCIYADLRHAAGQSTGPLEVDRPWDAYTDDQLGLMDHLGIDRFMVLGFCIAGPFIWNLIKRAPDRVSRPCRRSRSGSARSCRTPCMRVRATRGVQKWSSGTPTSRRKWPTNS